MADKTKTRGTTKLFVSTIVMAGGLALALSLYELYSAPISNEWTLLAALTLLSFLFTVKVPGVPAIISISETFVFTTVLLFGTAAATVTVALGALIMSGWRHRREPLKVVFNATEPALSIFIASQIFFLIVKEPIRDVPRDAGFLLLPVLLLSLTYFLLNSTLTAAAISLQSGVRVVSILRGHLLWLSLNYLGGASVALLIVHNSTTVSATTIGIILPLLVITYLTFRSSMGRIEDANNHVDQLNRMYMSTIETLAMAVDAKDQVTHGHIRRVQERSVALARHMGVDDENLIKAIEAASLLHDMGKLAVPEHILNKPGKLTAEEFEVMKTHSSVGADILTAIDFPYPVVPIVRHHHENWDGTGYPDGLSGTDIPLGARILAVVDCFDALTSDRPYRGRLTVDDAIAILTERRGAMYDPLVVDVFIELQPHWSTLPEGDSVLTESSPLSIGLSLPVPRM
jgi:putative nucleotidyltransferase with HDIG domain